MKVGNFAVSIVYGSGHHFFVQYNLNARQEAIFAADQAQTTYLRRWGRKRKGPKPVAHIWERLNSREAETLKT